MEYKIYRPKEPPDQLSSEQFEKPKKNKDNLLEVLYIEEKYNLILENYAEFELELFNNNLKEMLYNNLDWSSSVKKIFSTNRRIINVLTVCRLYLDQVAHNISTIYGSNSEQEKVFKKLTHQEYDSNLAYEVMDCLRNYLQHRGLLKRLHYSSSTVKVNDNTFVKHTTSMFIDITELSHDGAFKKEKTLAKLEKQGKTFEFISFLRQYVESISKIHIKLREVLKSDTETGNNFYIKRLNLTTTLVKIKKTL